MKAIKKIQLLCSFCLLVIVFSSSLTYLKAETSTSTTDNILLNTRVSINTSGVTDNIETITLLAEPTEANQIAVLLRLFVSQGTIVNFKINPKLQATSLAECKGIKYYTKTNVCVDISNNPINKPFARGDYLGTLTIQWNPSNSGIQTIYKLPGNGYSNGSNFVEISNLPNYVSKSEKIPAPSLTDATPINLLIIGISLLGILLFFFALKTTFKNSPFAHFGRNTQTIMQGSTYVVAFSFILIGTILQIAQPLANSTLIELPQTGTSVSAVNQEDLLKFAYKLDQYFKTSETAYEKKGICGPKDTNNDGSLSYNELQSLKNVYLQECTDTSEVELAKYGNCGARDANHDSIINVADVYIFLTGYGTNNCNF